MGTPAGKHRLLKQLLENDQLQNGLELVHNRRFVKCWKEIEVFSLRKDRREESDLQIHRMLLQKGIKGSQCME